VFNCLDVPEVTRDPVELRPGCAHAPSSLTDRSARMTRSTIARS
jgi:hypothetical protein